jgi:hypothetical protein
MYWWYDGNTTRKPAVTYHRTSLLYWRHLSAYETEATRHKTIFHVEWVSKIMTTLSHYFDVGNRLSIGIITFARTHSSAIEYSRLYGYVCYYACHPPYHKFAAPRQCGDKAREKFNNTLSIPTPSLRYWRRNTWRALQRWRHVVYTPQDEIHKFHIIMHCHLYYCLW